jgi:hypothetical protein
MMLCFFCKRPVEKEEMVSGLHPACFCKWFHVSEAHDFQDVVARSAEDHRDEGDWARVNTSFFGSSDK